MDSLWPETVAATKITTPLSILREQGSILGKITGNILEGEVISATDENPGSRSNADLIELLDMSSAKQEATREPNPVFYHSFYIKVPSLGNYRYKLFYVHHPITLYPASIVVEGQTLKCADETEFKSHLRAVLSAKKTTDTLAALINQSGK